MPLPRYERLDEAQRARIFAAALAEFAQHGYEEASLARIATAADISKGTLYYYFADRDDVYATVVETLMDAAAAQGMDVFAPKRAADYWPAMETLFHDGFELAQKHPVEVRALRSFQTSIRRNPRPAFASVMKKLDANMRTIVETGRRLGCVRADVSVEVLVELLHAADEVLDRNVDTTNLDRAALARHTALALDTFRRLLAPASTKTTLTTKRRKGG